MSPGPKQFKRQKRKTHQNMIPILPSSPFFSPLLCLKSSFSAFQPHLSNFTPSLFKFGRGGGKWVISLCLVKELTHKKSRSVWESNPKSAKSLPLWSRRLFYTFRRGGKRAATFSLWQESAGWIQRGGTQESCSAVQLSCWGQWFIQCATCQKQNV